MKLNYPRQSIIDTGERVHIVISVELIQADSMREVVLYFDTVTKQYIMGKPDTKVWVENKGRYILYRKQYRHSAKDIVSSKLVEFLNGNKVEAQSKISIEAKLSLDSAGYNWVRDRNRIIYPFEEM